MGITLSTKNKDLNGFQNLSKEERKILISSLKAQAEKGFVRKDMWTEVVVGKGVPLQLAEALWNTFDRKGEGQLDLESLLPVVEKSLGGSDDYKLNLSFDFFDVDCTGLLTQDGVARILEYCYAYELVKKGQTSVSNEDRQKIREMTKLVFVAMDKDKDGVLTKEEFLSGVSENENLLKILKKF
eukprot:TRINITY_DN2180_c0_g1_i3.p1 TRINITY_DN2180_c0_g1~~TRINITY_DN2180_c0_g1_i3.p1  ORF type:complete len:184 (+),score=43.61 TRINITY_DN2180_c0_g1_i3:165-716(+)